MQPEATAPQLGSSPTRHTEGDPCAAVKPSADRDKTGKLIENRGSALRQSPRLEGRTLSSWLWRQNSLHSHPHPARVSTAGDFFSSFFAFKVQVEQREWKRGPAGWRGMAWAAAGPVDRRAGGCSRGLRRLPRWPGLGQAVQGEGRVPQGSTPGLCGPEVWVHSRGWIPGEEAQQL